MMLFFLIIIIVLVMVFPPAGLLAGGIWLYCLGCKMEKQQKESQLSDEIKINEYDYEVLEEMK